MSTPSDQGSATRLSSPLPGMLEARGGRPVLIALYGPKQGTVYPVEGEVIIGRADNVSIPIRDDSVSRRHTRLINRGASAVQVEDLGSKNGTWVNGRRVTTAELRNGDTIQVGNEVVFHFVYRDPVEQRLLERQKLEAIGRLAGGVAHEFNNLLSVMLGNLSHLQRELQAGSASELQREMLRDAVGAADRASDLTSQLLGLARRSRPTETPVNISALVGDLARLVGRTLVRDIQLETQIVPDLYIRGQPPELQQALLNLCINARDAMPTAGTLTLRVRPLAVEDRRRGRDGVPRGDFVEVQVEDTGVGMDPETLKHVFEPFFTTKEFKDGTGLGMAIVHGIVRSHSGYIDVQSAVGKGTLISMWLPTIERPALDSSAGAASGAARTTGSTPLATSTLPARTILLVEEDEALRRSVTRMLEQIGQRVISAGDGVEAVETFRRRGSQIDLVVLDLGMTRQSGVQTLTALRTLSPPIKVMLSSGWHHLEPELRASVQGVLPKPYTLQQLLTALRSLS